MTMIDKTMLKTGNARGFDGQGLVRLLMGGLNRSGHPLAELASGERGKTTTPSAAGFGLIL